MNLVIVESPTKARTISKFVGKDFEVKSSFGHVRDLPEKEFGIDAEHNFEPKYVILPKAKKTVSELKQSAKSHKVILATDADREGEAIAWHLVQALGLNPKNYQRIVFHEITEIAIKQALKNPRDIDLNLVDAQQARRILDRIVGYKLSPFLWRKVAKGLSAGRVQSVAVRLIVEREQEILKFKSEKYWTVEALLKPNTDPVSFTALLTKIDGKAIEKPGIKDGDLIKKVISELEGKDNSWLVSDISQKEAKRSPLPPFTTSTLQQTAWQKFHWSAKQTMLIAQQLYEGIEIGSEGSVGLVTYMRTDSLNLSPESLLTAKSKIEKLFGKEFILPQPRIFKTKSKSAQEAHEAIRPTDIDHDPEKIKTYLDPRQFKLYDLIWRRFLATQIPEAVFDKVTADINVLNFTFRASGSTLKFPGFLKVYPLKFEEVELPKLKEKEEVKLLELKPLEHETQPPPRYNEATLIKTLEEHGIGRPSTYAPTITTIQERKYVEKDEQKRLKPTEIGTLVNDILVQHFPNIVDIQFTRHMEEDLDDIAQGHKKWQPIIKDFWEPFLKNLTEKEKEISKKELTEEKTDLKCPECGGDLVIRMGRFGRFYACSNFPKCRYTKTLEASGSQQIEKMPCPKCNEGLVVRRKTKKGRFFYGCSRWPKCDFASWQKPKQENQ